MMSALFSAALLVMSASAAAGEVIVDPDVSLQGDDVRVRVIFLNDADTELTLPKRVDALWLVRGSEIPVTLEAAESTTAIKPGAFARLPYLIRGGAALPQQAGVTLSMPAPWASQVELHLGAAGAEPALASPPTSQDSAPPIIAVQEEPASATVADNFSTYEPVYAILGLQPLNAKLQFSFKYALVDPDSDAAARWSFLRGVYFGYTQTMFWDLGEESSPFRSIDFKPELFYRYSKAPDWFPVDEADLGFQTGLRHVSNGREEPVSRSFNEAYLEARLTFPLNDRTTLSIAPRAWFYFGDLEDNPNIDDYRGHSFLRLRLEDESSLLLETKLSGYVGTDRGSFQTDISRAVGGDVLGNLNLRAHAQLFTGYGDNLFEYDRHVTRLRIGVSLFE